MNRIHSVSTFLLAILLFGAAKTHAQTTSEPHSIFHFSFFPPLSTNGKHAAQYTNDFSLNLLAGISQNERALTVAGLVNIIKNDATGVQAAGLVNHIGNNGRGARWAGLANIVGNDHTGAQWSGLLNYTGGRGLGAQWAGLANITRRDYTGAQWAGLANITRRDYTGAQWAGLVNITGYDFTGAQWAGLVNRTGNMRGLQIAGLVNVSDYMTGLQVAGLVNVANRVRGVQLAGLVNVAQSSDYPIGIVNIIKEGEMGISLGYNEIGTTSLTFRSGGRVLYGILGFGYNHKPAKEGEATVIGGYGAHINILPWLRINNEITSEVLGIFGKESSTFKSGYSLLPAFRLGHFELFGGPSVNYMHSEHSVMFDAFPANSFWEHEDTTRDGKPRLRSAFIGWQAAVQFIF